MLIGIVGKPNVGKSTFFKGEALSLDGERSTALLQREVRHLTMPIPRC